MFMIINILKEAEGFYILDIGTVFHQGICQVISFVTLLWDLGCQSCLMNFGIIAG